MTSSFLSIHVSLNLGVNEKPISFESQNQRLAIIGPSGCGKSSFAKALAGIKSGVKGKIEVNGRVLLDSFQNINISPWERNISYLPQDIQLIPHLTVKENILFPKGSGFSPEVVQHLGISYLLERVPRNLSGGEKQRVALARAISFKPDLLILDEPFSSLDEKNKKKTISFLEEFTRKNNIPLILITHLPQELESFDPEIHSFE